jgi:hypothetical protein
MRHPLFHGVKSVLLLVVLKVTVPKVTVSAVAGLVFIALLPSVLIPGALAKSVAVTSPATLAKGVVSSPAVPATPVDSKTTNELPLLENTTTPLSPSAPTAPMTKAERFKTLTHRVENDVLSDETAITKDLAVLWQAAVERNSTIRYAIEKLSRKDATGKAPVDPWTKRLLGSLVNLGGVAGSVLTQSPVGILGSGVVQEALGTTSAPDPTRLPVTDADMVILAKSVDGLQTQLFEHYLAYRQSKQLLTMCQASRRAMAMQLTSADPNNVALEVILDITQQDLLHYQQAFSSARNALALLTGTEAVQAIEQQDPKAG